MQKDMLNFLNNEFYKTMIKNRGVRGFPFSIKSFFAILGSVFLFSIVLNNISEFCLEYETRKAPFYILLSLFILSGVYLLIKSFIPIYFYFISKSWIKIIANINDIYISEVRFVYSIMNGYNVWHPKINYSFKVNGTIYKGNRLSFENEKFEYKLDPNSSSRYHKPNFDFGNWVETKKVEIYYNPKNPNQSVIYRKLNVFSFIVYSFIAILFLLVFSTIFLKFIYYCYIV
ncbi:DUF3592 domain-containing protein [Halarcobacter sp.]|uniref:DUF3592 domain-containing protein n=1 Tax=Halarcobacter sp. TaxID=2321133 RepID=UPI0029F54736|nr:DUF3592 domain-containing protein [Halarcobacter sp.]